MRALSSADYVFLASSSPICTNSSVSSSVAQCTARLASLLTAVIQACTMFISECIHNCARYPYSFTHRYMDLTAAQIGYFNEQVGLSAASFGVASDDVTTVGNALNSVFNVRCPMNATVVPAAGPQAQSICTDSTCPLAANASTTCPAPAAMPFDANDTLAEGQGIPMSSSAAAASSSSSAGSSASSKPSSSTAWALDFPVLNALGLVALVIGAVACGLLL